MILPTLAEVVTLDQAKHLPFPLIGFFKYDGIRALGHPKLGLVSRRLKPIPNTKVREKFRRSIWLDGELIFGKPTDENCYHLTDSCVMTKNAPADGVYFYIFDWFQRTDLPYTERRRRMEVNALFGSRDVRFAPMYPIKNYKALLTFEEKAVKLGYEGIMLRRPDGRYKYGRSTVNEGILLKLKRFVDDEVRIVGIYPRKKNTNKLERDERGYAKRSSHKKGKVAQEELGGFMVVPVKGRKKVPVKCGTGILKQDERRRLWKVRDRLPGRIFKRRSQLVGVKNKPRFPRFAGWRSKIDF